MKDAWRDRNGNVIRIAIYWQKEDVFIQIPFENGFSANNVVKIVEYEGNDPDECLKKGSRFEL